MCYRWFCDDELLVLHGEQCFERVEPELQQWQPERQQQEQQSQSALCSGFQTKHFA